MSHHRESKGDGSYRNGRKITTLYLSSLNGKLKRDKILDHFSAFGEVENVRVRNKPKRSYGFVKFSQAESVEKALEIEFHTIAEHNFIQSVKVSVAYDRHQEKSSLLGINDYCILEILSMKCLDAFDLCSIAETCSRLKIIAGRAFGRKHKVCDLNSLTKDKVEPSKRLLRNFGPVISDLRVRGMEFKKNWTSVLDSLTRHCNTLTSLDLSECAIPEKFTAYLRPIFKSLQELSIDRCEFRGDSKNLFAACGSLVKLYIRTKGDISFIIDNTFPKLEQFDFNSTHFRIGKHFEVRSMESFISRHSNLKTLKIWKYKNGSSLVPIIADNCWRLEILKCRIPVDTTINLINLGHLRKLVIDCDGRSVAEAVQRLKSLDFLENLQIYRAKIDSEFFGTISQLQRLQALQLTDCIGYRNLNRLENFHQLTKLNIFSFANGNDDDFDIVTLIERLSNLKYLTVFTHFEMDSETYMRIVAVVQARPDRSQLNIRVCDSCPGSQCEEFNRHHGIVNMKLGPCFCYCGYPI